MLAYQGKIEEGRFIWPLNVNIPQNGEFVMVFNEPINDNKNVQNRLKSWERFFNAINDIQGEVITDADIALLQQNRVNFNKDLGGDMNMMYVLDSNIISYLLKGDLQVREKLREAIKSDVKLVMPHIVHYEIERWLIERGAINKRNEFERMIHDEFSLVELIA